MPPAAPSHWCDAHCHLHDIPPHDGFAALADARAAGLAVLVHCGTQPANWPLGARLATADSAVVPCFGLHPYWAAAPGPWLDELRAALLAQPSAVGEIGLDRTRHGAPWPQQEAAFAAQLALAAELERPAMIHAVRTWQPLLTHLDAHRPPRFLLHAYNGSAELVPQLLARGAWFSFAGATLRPERARAHAALRAVPADRLLAESDAPAVPLPGRAASRPADLPEIVAGLAALRGEPADELAAQIWANSAAFLGELWP